MHRLYCDLKEHSSALPQREPSALAKSNASPSIQQNNNKSAVQMAGTTSGILFQVELIYHIHHSTLSSTIGYNMSPIFSVNPTPLISVSHCFGIHMAQPMKEKIM